MIGESSHESRMLRQRRNFLVSSVVIILVEWAQLKLTGFNAQGFLVTIGNPDAVKIVLWLLWLYWLYRYYLVYKEAEPNLIAEKDRLRRRLAESRFSEFIRYDENANKIIAHQEKKYGGTFSHAMYLDSVRFSRDDHKNSYHFMVKHIDIFIRNEKSEFINKQQAEFVLLIPYSAFSPHEKIIRREAMLQTSFITDYYAPFALGGVVSLIHYWSAGVAAYNLLRAW